MAWLQNLAGKAENLLNKIDQNAATVLNESTSKSTENIENASIIIEPNEVITDSGYDYTDNLSNENAAIPHNTSFTNPPVNLIDEDLICDNASIHSVKSKLSDNDSLIINAVSRDSASPFENVVALQMSEGDSMAESMPYCSQLPEDLLKKYEERITYLEVNNQDLNKQLLNIQHLYRELQNDNSNLQLQVERANLHVEQAQNEMEHYKIRAHRVLQEKAAQKETSVENLEVDNSVIASYNEELKKEVQFQEEKNRELTDRLNSLTNDFTTLRQQYIFLQNSTEENKNSILHNLAQEKKYRNIAEEECKVKTKDLQSALFKLSEDQEVIVKQNQQIEELKQQLKQRKTFTGNEDVESRIQGLTQMLMTKQSSLESITTERNALRIQLEKLETEYRKMQYVKTPTNVTHVDDLGESRTNVPKLMVVSPFDVGMTRRVKQTYSTLDALSIRSGVFLRRYPLARIFVFCYMTLLHIWVLIILCTYIPTSR